ncbi:CCHC-type zinc finger transcription factor [Phycomyces blakesleeanus NRRL 1555(-)]|uniref:CCHC-type zinc finger transcription factor n=1 Tax=Phycomyces blakesleeanus (strain ATCC 8743b / DSM 1359 / FGSC 10004 / NBRC 33097 / NRRL 1555) TaxID=763407 RepID=A0A162TYQ8_PHYB8|nr:CCHC-type zinc finger transcription factor [Phycomyces blakesleeanus NRRL 1555(-)]OAD70893.1 CCHC-type zinc finger transcription factor [Phycomyces blakesleeanus NRRL 1555(-)]|eukprot:XP_018288933.1 CCHC-type zinc finger transcription factor [Phycomyces blakesleeanus NRRL 1555(-)]
MKNDTTNGRQNPPDPMYSTINNPRISPQPSLNGSPTHLHTVSPSDISSSTLSQSAKPVPIFGNWARIARGKPVTIFDDASAKAELAQQKANQMWISSNEDNAVVFDITDSGLDAAQFFQALKSQYPSVVGALGQDRRDRNIAIVSFDTIEDVPRACSEGVVVGHQTLLATPTFGGDSNILRVHLDKLPLRRADKLEPRVQEVMGLFGRVIHIGLYMDPQFQLFGGKGFVMLDTAPKEGIEYIPLTHKIDFRGEREIYAKWQNMPVACNYCHGEGHRKANCEKRTKSPRLCYGCKKPGHIRAQCPDETIEKERKRQRQEDPQVISPENGGNNRQLEKELARLVRENAKMQEALVQSENALEDKIALVEEQQCRLEGITESSEITVGPTTEAQGGIAGDEDTIMTNEAMANPPKATGRKSRLRNDVDPTLIINGKRNRNNKPTQGLFPDPSTVHKTIVADGSGQ